MYVSVMFRFSTPNQVYCSYIMMDRIHSISELEGNFVEAVIGYIFIVNLSPMFIVPLMWYESPKIAEYLNIWSEFEV